jgi:enoyl-CoA hydratase/3-hydroxyacyl-CoA dehydrogenase
MAVRSLVPPDPIAVLGAGNMGSGIAQAAAQAGYRVRLRDLNDAMLERGRASIEKTLDGAIQRRKLTEAKKQAILERIEFTTDIAAAVRDAHLVIEAIFEEEPLKLALFAEVAKTVPEDAIVATNTSSLSVTRLGSSFPHPGRFAGLHFFYPAAINKLLEVIGGEGTAPETTESLTAFGYRLRKIPIDVRDAPGFAVNRFFVPYLNEAARLLEDGAASMATIEEVGREVYGTTLGPFELMNVTGIPIAFHSITTLSNAFGGAYAPSPRLKAQFDSKASWPWRETPVEPEKKGAVRERFLGLTFGIAARLVEEEVASPEATDRGAVVGLRWKLGPFALMNGVGLAEAHRLVEGYARRWGEGFPVARALRDAPRGGHAEWPLRSVRIARRGPVAWVLLDRPEVLNSINSRVLDQLEDAFRVLDAEPEIRCVVLAGSSPVFAAGADIAEMAGKDVAAGKAFGFRGQAVCERIANFRAPVIALVEGYALGGGLELALAADFIVAAEGAKLGLPEVGIGIHPGFGGASRLARQIGTARTKLLVFSAEPISSEAAEKMGFVARVLAADRARAEVAALAEGIASKAPLAVAWVKAVIDRGAALGLAEALQLEGESAARTFGTADRTEGMRAFMEGRRPKFTGQ